MTRRKTIYLLVILCLGIGCSRKRESVDRLVPTKIPYPERDGRAAPLIMAHYMSWYTTKPVSGEWAFFWTMNSRNPDRMDENGRREIASHYYPLTGPYDLSDPDILEYHVLLMRLSGIDGIVVNWAGTIEWGLLAMHPEARALRFATENARNIIEYGKRAGLRFVLNFEDRAALRIAGIPLIGGHKKALTVTQEMLRYAEDHWLMDPYCVSVDGQPVFTFFGPLYFKNRMDFDALFSGLKTPLILLTVHPRFQDISQFYWLPVGPEGFGHVSLEALGSHMSDFQKRASHWRYVIAGATPGFHDYWVEGGGNDVSFGSIAHNNGKTLQFTLDKALEGSPQMIQVITWNDYIEGSMIEPTVEFGNTFLEVIQEFKRKRVDPTFSFSPEDLRLPLRIFDLRKRYAHDLHIQDRLDDAFELIVRGEIREAVGIMNTLDPAISATATSDRETAIGKK